MPKNGPKVAKIAKIAEKTPIFPKDCPFSLSNSTFCGSKLANLCSYDPGKSFWPFFGNFQNLTYAPHKRSNLTLSIFFLSTTIKSLQITKKTYLGRYLGQLWANVHKIGFPAHCVFAPRQWKVSFLLILSYNVQRKFCYRIEYTLQK